MKADCKVTVKRKVLERSDRKENRGLRKDTEACIGKLATEGGSTWTRTKGDERNLCESWSYIDYDNAAVRASAENEEQMTHSKDRHRRIAGRKRERLTQEERWEESKTAIFVWTRKNRRPRHPHLYRICRYWTLECDLRCPISQAQHNIFWHKRERQWGT